MMNRFTYSLASLPYTKDALEPHISANTVTHHYEYHHAGYVKKLNEELAKLSADDALLKENSIEGVISICLDSMTPEFTKVFNNAAQIWNHDFFWQSMQQNGGGMPKNQLSDMIIEAFGDYKAFREAFVNAGLAQFGSGWVWLVYDGSDEQLKIKTTGNAGLPQIFLHEKPLLVCDVWEHAYYLDYQHKRKDFVETFLDHLVNWDFAASNLSK